MGATYRLASSILSVAIGWLQRLLRVTGTKIYVILLPWHKSADMIPRYIKTNNAIKSEDMHVCISAAPNMWSTYKENWTYLQSKL